MSSPALGRLTGLLSAGAPSSVALHGADGSLTYAELTAEVTAEAGRLGPDRRVAVVPLRNDVESVVRLLGALQARHPVLVLGPDKADRQGELVARYAGARDLHPDLALLLSTSGSTGSPKLVRLSHTNLEANARSIRDYLSLSPDDCAITSLPLTYCYGLSVLTSHLVAGASIALTDLSVADDCFWDLARTVRATGFAGVPYTFQLLDGSGFAERELPDLRYVTQAGGRMPPERVQQFAALGAERGFELFVMYGQTEATARMAYLPPHLAATRPTAVGVPVPQGHFRLAHVEGHPADVGELVYTGPNVMMGYATSAADLAEGPQLTELRTGDLARQDEDGLWEVCGRIDKVAKVFGLRLDLGRLEDGLEGAHHAPAALVARGDMLHAFIDRPRMTATVRDHLVAATGLPPGSVQVHQLAGLPRNARGKIDYAALRRHAEVVPRPPRHGGCAPGGSRSATPSALRDLYAEVLGRPAATVDDSFVGLGGDSLSFVELSVQLGARLGHLPRGWQHLTPVQLAAAARPREPRRWSWTPVEVPVLMRALAIVLIVVSHADVWVVMGGAHVLLGLAGFSLARFGLPVAGRAERSRRLLATTASVALPAALWIFVAGRVTGDYDVATSLLLNQVVGPDSWSLDWQFWFLEVLVWCYVGIAVVLRAPAVDRWQRREPFAVAMVVVAVALTARYATTGVAADGVEEYAVAAAAWCLAIGWATAEARTAAQRWLVVATTVVGCAGFFPEDLQRQAVLMVGLLALHVTSAPRLPATLVTLARHLAHASLWIYLTHWQVYPPLEAAGHPWLAVLASLAVGVASHHLATRVRRVLLPGVTHRR